MHSLRGWAASALIAWCGCTESSESPVDFACEDDDDCLPGFVCGAAAGSKERLCFERTSAEVLPPDSGAESKDDAGRRPQPQFDGGQNDGSAGAGAAGTGETHNAGTGGRGASDSGRPPTIDPEECTSTAVHASRIAPTVMLLIDGSGSMQDNLYPPMSMTTRWAAVRSALVDMTTGVVAQLQGVVKFGLAVYGTGPFDPFAQTPSPMCPLPLGVVAPALDNYAAIMSGIGPTPPGVFTPTGLALNAIVDMLPDGQPTDPDIPPEPQIIVLATDGNPNDCMPQDFMTPNYQPSLDAAMKAAAKHQQLFVISVGTDADRNHLQQVANLGAGLALAADPGAPVFYPENVSELATTLSTLIDKNLGCEVTLDARVMPGQECHGSVAIDGGAPLECNDQNGWRLIDANRIELLGTACAAFKTRASAQLAVNFPCEVLEP